MKYRDSIISCGVAVCVFFLFLYTSSRLPLTWDEGVLVSRSDTLLFWIQRVAIQVPAVKKMVSMTPELEFVYETDSVEMLFSPWAFESFCYSDEGHPGFPVFLNAFGRTAAPSFLPFKTRLRFGNILFFSFAAGAVFFRLKKDFSTKTALFGILSLLLIPRLFTHAQIAHYDSPLIAAWLLSWVCFPAALKSPKGAAVFGGCIGLTVACKFSGVGVLLPPILWIAVRLLADRFTITENRWGISKTELLKRAFIATITALFVFWIFSPRLWFDPIAGMEQFVYLNTHRTFNIPVLFFGTMYDLYYPLPWYNTIVWTAITVPIGILALFGVGLVMIIRDKNKRWGGLFLFLNMSVLLVMRALPGTPVHDGVRLFIPAFAFLAIIAAIGAAELETMRMNRKKVSFLSFSIFHFPFSILIFAVCAFNMFWYAPQWLSFYNLAIGGLPGAVRAGMEPTYYWDGLDDEVFSWLKTNVKTGEKVAFSGHSPETLLLCFDDVHYQIPFDIIGGTSTLDGIKSLGYRYYVLQKRPSAESGFDEQLTKQIKPVFVKTIRKGGFGHWNLSTVPIIEIYDLEQDLSR